MKLYFPSFKTSAYAEAVSAFGHPVDERDRSLIKICIYFNSSQSVEMADWAERRITRFAYSRRSAYISASYRKIFNSTIRKKTGPQGKYNIINMGGGCGGSAARGSDSGAESCVLFPGPLA